MPSSARPNIEVDYDRLNERRLELVAKDKNVGLTRAEFKELRSIKITFLTNINGLFRDDEGISPERYDAGL